MTLNAVVVTWCLSPLVLQTLLAVAAAVGASWFVAIIEESS